MISAGDISSRKKVFLLCGAALLLGFVAFLPSIVAWFSAEELVLISAVRHDPFAIWSGRDGTPGFFRPVIPLIVWVWYHLFGISPRPYHLLNVVLHLVNSLLVYAIARGWTRALPESHVLRGRTAAFVAALWFWVWPSHSEPVSWIPALTDVAAATWALAAVAGYLRYANTRRLRWASLAVVLYAGGLCTKESVITLPAIIGIYELQRMGISREFRWRSILWPVVFLAIMAGYFLLRWSLMGVFIGGYGESVHTDFSWSRMRWALSPNLANAFFPWPGLSVYQKDWLMPLSGLACAGGVLWRSVRRGGDVTPILAIFLAALAAFLPALNLGPGFITEGQRFAYFASAFAVIFMAWTMVYVVRERRKIAVMAGIVAIGCASLLTVYNNHWHIAGRVAREAVRGMKKLPPTRRVYVLATTDSYREAFILPHSLETVKDLLEPESRAGTMLMGGSVNFWNPQTSVTVERQNRNGEAGYLVTLNYSGEKSNTSPSLDPLTGPSEYWTVVQKEGEELYLQPKGFDPETDVVAWLDGGEWKTISE